MSDRIYYVGLDETSWTLILSLLRYLSKMDDKEVSEAYGSILKEVENQICTDDEDPISAPPD
jgi:hypothetical protein